MPRYIAVTHSPILAPAGMISHRYQGASEMRADLKRLKRESDSGRTATIAEAPVPVKLGRRWITYAVLAAVVIAIAEISNYLFFDRDEPIDSIAVLPFYNEKGDEETQFWT
jgi:hypothetical protein